VLPYKDPVKRAEYQAQYYQDHKPERAEYMRKRYWRLKLEAANFEAEIALKDITIKEWWEENGC